MKANEAPEKIILSADRDTQIIYDDWVVNDYTDSIKIEYIRTDAFIEKAERYIRSIADGLDKDDDVEAFISGFIKAMKGE